MLRSVACRVARPPHSRALRVACVQKGRMPALAVRRTPVRPFAGPSGSLAKRGLMTKTNTPEAKRSDQSTEEISKVEAEITELKEQVVELEAREEDYMQRLDRASTAEEKKDYRAMLVDTSAMQKDTSAQLQSKNSVLDKLLLQKMKPQSVTVPVEFPPEFQLFQHVFQQEFQQDHPIVAMEDVVRTIRGHIDEHAPKATTVHYRVPPVSIPSMARSGKTTALVYTYNALLASECSPIYVTFNDSSKFKFIPRDGESDADAFLRQVAAMLLPPDKVPDNMVCSRDQLEHHLAKSAKPVVLLVDELNAVISEKHSVELANILREMFLDKPGRYLVYTSHWDVPLQEVAPRQKDSPRETLFVPVAQTKNLQSLKSMWPDGVTLTNIEAAIHGWLPGLLYEVKRKHGMIPSERFEDVTLQLGIEWTDESVIEGLVPKFLREFIFGDRTLPDLERFTYRPPNNASRIAWPLCYAEAFLREAQLDVLADEIKRTSAAAIASKGKSSTGDGKVWEFVVCLGICVVSISARYRDLTPAEQRVVGTVPRHDRPRVRIWNIPEEIKDPDAAFKRLHEYALHEQNDDPMLIVGLPESSQMEAFDCFTYYLPRPGSTEAGFKYGQQMKPWKGYPKNDTPKGVVGVLLRGDAPDAAGHSRRGGWDYLTAGQVDEFLPFSLKHLVPSELTNQ